MKTEQGRVMVFLHSPSSHCKKNEYQVWSHLNIRWQCYAQDKKCFLKNKGVQFKNGTRLSYGSCALHFRSLQETCTPSLKSFESMVTNLHSGQEMVYKNQSKGNNSKRNKVELKLLCTALRVIARKMHTKFGVIWTYGEKLMLRIRNAT